MIEAHNTAVVSNADAWGRRLTMSHPASATAAPLNAAQVAGAGGARLEGVCCRAGQLSWIGYWAKIASARLNAFAAAASGVIPLLMMSEKATWNTCSESSCAAAGLYAS